MESWKGLLIAFAIIGVFSISIFNFVVLMQVGNDVNDTILDNPVLSRFNKSVYTDLSNLNKNTSDYKNATDEEQKEEQNYAGEITLGSIFHSFSTFIGFILGFGSTFFTLLAYLGISPLILGVLTSILIITAVLLFWRLWKQGQ